MRLPEVHIENWGFIPYLEALDKQEIRMQEVIKGMLNHRDEPAKYPVPPASYLIFCEHPPVYTLGNKARLANLLLTEQALEAKGIQVIQTRRGGDITFHGPGQLVVYPVLDLSQFFTDVHKYLRLLEETIILTLADLGIRSGRIPGLTGVWVGVEEHNDHTSDPRKICAIGVRCSRWVTQHGLAININTDLNYFNSIIPCGITEYGVTSIEQELGKKTGLGDIAVLVKKHFQELFLTNFSPDQESETSFKM